MLQKSFAGRRQLNAVSAAIHQGNADFLFEIPDLPAERWLGSVEFLLGGNSQTACIRHGDEVAEMPKLHHNLPYLTGMGPAYKVFFKPASALYIKKHWTRGLPGRAHRGLDEFVRPSAPLRGLRPARYPDRSVRMRKTIRASLLCLLVTGFGGAAAQSTTNQLKASGMETDIAKIKQAMLGNWESIAPEIRPSKNPDGSLKPFYLKRTFKYQPSDRFELEVVNSADPYGAVPLARIKIGGHMLWQGSHPIAPGAQKVDFVADETYEVTPLAQGFADILNKIASAGYAPWAVNSPQSIFGKAFVPFGLKEGTNFMEYDLVYLGGDLLFWGGAISMAAASIRNRIVRLICRSRWSGNSAGLANWISGLRIGFD
jgi:hypothetical protein